MLVTACQYQVICRHGTSFIKSVTSPTTPRRITAESTADVCGIGPTAAHGHVIPSPTRRFLPAEPPPRCLRPGRRGPRALLQLCAGRSRPPHPKSLGHDHTGDGSTCPPAGCPAALRHILGHLVDTPRFARGAELLTKAAASAPLKERPMPLDNPMSIAGGPAQIAQAGCPGITSPQ